MTDVPGAQRWNGAEVCTQIGNTRGGEEQFPGLWGEELGAAADYVSREGGKETGWGRRGAAGASEGSRGAGGVSGRRQIRQFRNSAQEPPLTKGANGRVSAGRYCAPVPYPPPVHVLTPARPASLRGPKISKACEECRRRKQKCNGLSPCNVCSRRNTVCSYRSFIRRRTGRTQPVPAPTPTPGPHLAQEPPRPEDRDGTATSADRESSHADSSAFSDAPPRYHIYKNIRATHVPADSPSCVLQLYYGSSSNFSFLQHLHTHLTAHDAVPRPDTHVEEVQNGNESIDVYKYQGLAFGNTPGQRETNPMFLRHELARTFLHNYLSAVHPHLPFLSTDQLCANFERLYGYGDDAKIDPSERALVIVAMAIGACPSQHDLWRKTLLAQARSEADSLLHVVNLRAVQIALLMIRSPIQSSKPRALADLRDTPIVNLLSATRTRVTCILAAPSVKHSPPACTEGAPPAGSLSGTVRNLICSGLGRPSSLSLQDIGLSQPERPSFMSAQVTLSELIRSVQHFYNHHDSSVSADLKHAHRIRNKLRTFAQTVKDDFGFALGSHLGTERDEDFVVRAVISYCKCLMPVLLLLG
ncbi:c6 zinc finger domain protein [Diplodia corticola]|uniref:C6 zinc finger domain protein n=1 Tax=Diplodia corticola TaxID=236234 RepID=A0A1J9R3Z2_9PEZI|nr:c6 zinc finger domain protein [Diplodia corticola]OJD36174.1 c6 zinc finger domain protein [Diplodia corticola]